MAERFFSSVPREIRPSFFALTEGYFSPSATLERSLSAEEKASPIVEEIKRRREEWLQSQKLAYQSPFLEELVNQWPEIPKGREEELNWTIETIAFIAALFEEFQREKQGKENFALRDNQLYYILLLLLNKGKYAFAELATDSRGGELATGEGKTFAFGLIGLIMALRGENVHFIEPNYLSAIDHANQMADFMTKFGLQVGVAVNIPEEIPGQSSLSSRKSNIAIIHKKVVRENGLIEEVIEPLGGGSSFLYQDGKLVRTLGSSGRERVWQCPIVFVDPQALGFDYLRDRLVGRGKRILPNLGETTALIAEADEIMIDRASEAWIMDVETFDRREMWDNLVETLQIEGIVSPEIRQNLPPEEKRKLAQIIIFAIWNALLSNKEEFKKGRDGDYLLVDNQLILSANAYHVGEAILANNLAMLFAKVNGGLNEDYEKEIRKAQERVMLWLEGGDGFESHLFVLEAALRVLLGMRPEREFLRGKEEPVLLDQYGFPLERRRLEFLYPLFLQMAAFWPEWQREIRRPEMTEEEVLWQIINKKAGELEMSWAPERAVSVSLYRQYGTLRFGSGSLLPSSLLFAELYGAEVFKVERHEPINWDRSWGERENVLTVECLDGGPARVDFYPQRKGIDGLWWAVVKEMVDMRIKGRMALIIVPNIEEARELAELMYQHSGLTGQDIVVVTGKEELEQRGRLTSETAKGKAGKIIITTHIACRDIDLYVPEEVKENGGPIGIVIGLPPNERALWQALQRVIRSDIPGQRRLMLSGEDLEGILYRFLLFGSRVSPLEIKLKLQERILKLWAKVLNGDLRAKKEIFTEYLSYLRAKEYRRLDQLMVLLLENEQWEEWKERISKAFKENYFSGGIPIVLQGEEIRHFYYLWHIFLEEIKSQLREFLLGCRTKGVPLKNWRSLWFAQAEKTVKEFIEGKVKGIVSALKTGDKDFSFNF